VRKFIGIVAVLALCAIALTGCNGGSDDKSAPTSGGSAANTAGGTPAPAADKGKITIAWAQWDPSNYLQTLSKDFTKETGIAVDVQQIPWPDYQNKIQTGVWTGHSDAYDIIVGDSQWLGRGATEGHYVDLTDWAKTNVPWDQISPSAKQFYCEYEGKTWAVPCEADAIGFAYRKDLFEDPKEMAAFKAKYKRDLAPPKTWDEFKDVAEFFTRPSGDKPLYGCAIFYAGPGSYDGITMGFMQVLWAFGGDLHDASGKVQGVINSPASVKALDFYTKTLKAYVPPGSENYYFNECLEAFRNGKVAMTMDWFTFFPALVDKAKNTYADKTGFFVVPKGPAGEFVSLGGQGASISAYSKHQDEAKQFLAWFSKQENQAKWAKLGGLTSNQEVLKTDDFKKATPYNETFAESAPYLKDFYNNPKYAELLDVTLSDWNGAVTGSKTAQAAMDDIAQKHTQILKDMKQ